MTHPQSTITQDEYDALKITLAARDAEIVWMQIYLANTLEIMDHLLTTTNAELSDLQRLVIVGAKAKAYGSTRKPR